MVVVTVAASGSFSTDYAYSLTENYGPFMSSNLPRFRLILC